MSQSGVNPGDRRRRAAELHRQGLTLAEIGRRLGITRQAAFKLVKKARGDDAGAVTAATKTGTIVPVSNEAEAPPPARVPTRLTFTGQPADDVEVESEAGGDSWNARKWNPWP